MATPAERRAYARKLKEIERRFGTLERETLKRSVNLLRDLRANIAGRLTQEENFVQFQMRELQANLDAMITQYEGQLRALSNGGVRGAYDLGQRSVVEPLQALGLENLYFQPSPAQVNVLVDFTADLIGGIGNNIRRGINREIQLASLGGKSTTQAMQDITMLLFKSKRPPTMRETAKGVAYEAERILRTEMGRASNLAAQSQQTELLQQVPGLRKQWIATGDARTRISHLEAHGQTVPVDKPFIVGGERLMFPGDPAASAEQTINCRCTHVTVIPEVEDLSTPIDKDVQAELKRRQKIAYEKFSIKDEIALIEKGGIDIFEKISPPPGRAPRGKGKEYATRRRVVGRIKTHINWRSSARQHLQKYRGQTGTRARWRIDVATERIQHLDQAITTMLDISNSAYGEWGFVDELTRGISEHVSALRVMAA